MQVTPENIATLTKRLDQINALREKRAQLECLRDNSLQEIKVFCEGYNKISELGNITKAGSLNYSTDSVGSKSILDLMIKDCSRQLRTLGYREPKAIKSC